MTQYKNPDGTYRNGYSFDLIIKKRKNGKFWLQEILSNGRTGNMSIHCFLDDVDETLNKKPSGYYKTVINPLPDEKLMKELKAQQVAEKLE